MNLKAWRVSAHVSVCAISMGLASAAQASENGTVADRADAMQPTDELVAEKSQLHDDIVVTASRISGAVAPTPTLSVSEAQLEAKVPVTLAEAVNDLPQLAPTTTLSTNNTSLGGGLQGANMLDLRHLGSNRTLTLLDGHRVIGSSLTGSVDVNLLPAALVQRVEVVTGGASAAWGSDAVAGVVNFILNRKFKGLKAEALSGISQQGDVRTNRAEVSWGTPFADGRGHFVASGFIADISSSDSARSRSWYRGWQIVSNPDFRPGNGQPTLALAPNVGLAFGTPGGVILAGPLRGVQFGPGGTVDQYDFGYLSGVQQIGGTFVDSMGAQVLSAPLKQINLFARASYDLSNAVNAYVEGSYGRSNVEFSSIYNLVNSRGTILRDNAFLPAALRTRMINEGINSFVISRRNDDLGRLNTENLRQLYRGLVNIEGRIGERWKWSAYYQYGRSKTRNAASNNINLVRYVDAIDSIVDTSGAIVCRSRNPGCVPFNPFGLGSPSAAASAYVTGTASQNIVLQQHVAETSIEGQAIDLWAGPLSVAGGVGYRKEAMTADADPVSIANGWFLGNYKPTKGAYEVAEVFGEATLPVLKDSALGRLLELNGAVRYTHYSTSGGVVTWKAGASYEPIAGLRFRGTRSRDIRAPNLRDLYLGGQTNNGGVTDPFNPTAPSTIVPFLTTGNPDLQPEIGMATTFGFAYRPHWLRGFGLSVDYYKIKLRDAISTPLPQAIVEQCFAGATQFCSQITRSTSGAITGLRIIPVNAQQQVVSGIDIEVSLTTGVSWLSTTGQLDLRVVAANTREFRIVTNGVVDDNLGELAFSGPPKWRILGSVGYRDEGGSLTLSGRWLNGGVFNNAFTPAIFASNKVGAAAYFDLAGSLVVAGGRFELFGSITNLFNRDPEAVTINGPSGSNLPGTTPEYFDVIGRQFRIGVRLKL